MRARLDAAEARIAELESGQSDNWLTEQRSEEIRGLVHDVLADADTRASLLQSGMTAGYDNGAVLGSADGNWLMRTNLHMQQRYIYGFQDEDNGFDSDRAGFENTRTKFIISGHAVNPDWVYRVDVNVGANGSGRVGTLNAYLGHHYGNGWSIYMGSMKAPLLREELVESQYQLAVERSIVNYIFTGGYIDGVILGYEGDQWRGMISFNDGAGTGQTIWSAMDTEFAFTGRAEVLFQGTWDQFDDFTSPEGDETGFLLGGGFHYQNGEYGGIGTETDILVLTIDGSLEFGGANIFAAFMYSDFDFNTVGVADVSPWGVVVQGGLMFATDWEGFLRWEYADLDTAGVGEVNVLTFGVNKYFAGHNSKWTTDIGYSFDTLTGPANITGFRTDGMNFFNAPPTGPSDGQLVLRTQWQLLF